MSKDEQRYDSLQFSLHNLQISLSLCKDHFWNLGVTSFNSVNQVVIKR